MSWPPFDSPCLTPPTESPGPLGPCLHCQIRHLAICGVLIEDVASNWVVLFLDREAGAPLGWAALSYTVVLAAQFVGRIVGDPMTDRWGRETVARTGGLLIAVGAALTMLSPHYSVAFIGFALAGFGCATLVPAAFAAAAVTMRLPAPIERSVPADAVVPDTAGLTLEVLERAVRIAGRG